MSRYIAVAMTDHVELRRQQWAKELPDIDTEGMAILGRMRVITKSVRPPIEEIFARYGLDGGTFDVLATLLRSGSPYRLRPTELFEMLMMSSGGLTDRLRRLEDAGLITRKASSEDRRSLLVQLTAKGRRIAEAAFREDMALEATLLKELDPEDRSALAALLQKLAASL